MTKKTYDVYVCKLPWEEMHMLLEWLKNQKLASFENVTILTFGDGKDD